MTAMTALSGIKVLELSRVLAGPWCSMLLADLGADVIKIEPLDGDDTRGLGPPFKDDISAYFACCNRNKRSLAIDLLNPAARPLIDALVRDADVLIENYRTGTAEKLGVGYQRLHDLNPRLIYCSISGYGRVGVGAERPGYDFAIQAESGLMAITGPADGPPSKVGVAVADIATGQNAAIAILAALLARARDGVGQRVAVSLFDSQLSGLANVASACLFSGEEAGRYGNAHASIVPYQSFRAADGEFVLTVASEKLWRSLCQALDRPDWLDDPRYRDNAERVGHRDALIQEPGGDAGAVRQRTGRTLVAAIERGRDSGSGDQHRQTGAGQPGGDLTRTEDRTGRSAHGGQSAAAIGNPSGLSAAATPTGRTQRGDRSRVRFRP